MTETRPEAAAGTTAAPPETLDDDPAVVQIMTRRVVALAPRTDLAVALTLMADRQVRHLPVIDGETCIGILHEIDVVRGIAVGVAAHAMVAALARPAPVLDARDRRSVAARRLLDTDSDAAIVTERGAVSGILTATDLVRSLATDIR
ncbi:CBS domain-containing protein [Actinomycetes bacterium KLBMP 9759]